MNLVLKTVVALAFSAGLLGCEDIDGKLVIKKTFQVNTQSGVKDAPVGTYPTSLDFKRDRVVATLKTDSGKIKVSIQTPQGQTIPSNGEFHIPAQQSGQPFDIHGNNSTDEKRSETRREYQSCTIQDFETICTPQGCFARPVTRGGLQMTDYYIRTITRELHMNVVDQTTAQAMAQFSGRSSSSQEVIVRQDRCF